MKNHFVVRSISDDNSSVPNDESGECYADKYVGPEGKEGGEDGYEEGEKEGAGEGEKGGGARGGVKEGLGEEGEEE